MALCLAVGLMPPVLAQTPEKQADAYFTGIMLLPVLYYLVYRTGDRHLHTVQRPCLVGQYRKCRRALL